MISLGVLPVVVSFDLLLVRVLFARFSVRVFEVRVHSDCLCACGTSAGAAVYLRQGRKSCICLMFDPFLCICHVSFG